MIDSFVQQSGRGTQKGKIRAMCRLRWSEQRCQMIRVKIFSRQPLVGSPCQPTCESFSSHDLMTSIEIQHQFLYMKTVSKIIDRNSTFYPEFQYQHQCMNFAQKRAKNTKIKSRILIISVSCMVPSNLILAVLIQFFVLF